MAVQPRALVPATAWHNEPDRGEVVTAVRIAVVHSYYAARQPSGENAVVDAQVRALRSAGHEVELVAARTDLLEPQPLYPLRAAVTVATGHGPSPLRALRAFGPDVVHVHNLFPNFGSDWLRQWHGPLVATVHNFRPVCAVATLFRDGHACTECPDRSSLRSVVHGCYRGSRVATVPLAIRTAGGVGGDPLLQRAQRVILPARRTQRILESYGLDPHRSRVVPNFVDDTGFAPSVPPGSRWLFLGRLTEEKGVLELARHWPADRELDIVGAGPMEESIRALGRSNVRMLGAVPRERIPALLREARGLVFPSAWAEGAFPLVCIEALAAGRPVLARAGNAAADELPGLGAGVVFADWAGFGEALASADRRADELGRAARAAYEAAFTESAHVVKLDAVYREAIAA